MSLFTHYDTVEKVDIVGSDDKVYGDFKVMILSEEGLKEKNKNKVTKKKK